MNIDSNSCTRELSQIRMEKLYFLKNAFFIKDQIVERDIMPSESSGTITLSQESSVTDLSNESAIQNNIKRQVDYSSEEELHLSKYKKLNTEEKIVDIKRHNNLKTLTTSNNSSDECSCDEDKNHLSSTNNETNTMNSSSSNDSNYNKLDNNNHVKTECSNKLLEINADSNEFATSTSEEAHVDHIENKSHFSSINTLENHIVNVHNLTNFTGQEELKICDKQTNDVELHNSPSKELIIPENISHNKSNIHGVNYHEQEIAIKNLLCDAQYEIIDQHSNDNEFKKDNSNTIVTQVVSDVIISEPCDASEVYSSEQPIEMSLRSNFAEQNLVDTRRTSTDLTVAQLVLSLKQDIQELTKKVEKQESMLDAVVHANEINLAPLFAQPFDKKYGLNLPFSRIEDFDLFNQKLAGNSKFCNEFVTSLCSYIDNKVTLSKNILNMLRSHMSKELVQLYTASKVTGSKMVLKDTFFCKCLLQASKMSIKNKLLPLEHDRAFMKSLGLVMTGAKGWQTNDEDRRNNQQ